MHADKKESENAMSLWMIPVISAVAVVVVTFAVAVIAQLVA